MHDVVEDDYSTSSVSKYLTCFYPRLQCVVRNPIVDKLAAMNYCYDCIPGCWEQRKKKNKRKKKGKIIKQKGGKTQQLSTRCVTRSLLRSPSRLTTGLFLYDEKEIIILYALHFLVIFIFRYYILSNNVCVIPQSALIIANAVIPAWKAKASHQLRVGCLLAP